MAKKQKVAFNWKHPRLEGKTFAISGKFKRPPTKPISRVVLGGKREEPTMAQIIEGEKGTFRDKLDATVQYLIVGGIQNKASQAIQKRAARLNAKGANITLLDEQQFYDMFKPTPQETLAMLRAGPNGWKRWQKLSAIPWEQYGRVDLRGADLRDLAITWSDSSVLKIDLGGLNIDGADLRGATITDAYINYIKKVRFDGADLTGTFVQHCEDCSFKKVILTDGHAGDATRCNFDDAKFAGHSSSFTGEIRDCSCKRIDLTKTRLNTADVSGSDFTKALFKTDCGSYTIAKSILLVAADCRGADLDQSEFLHSDCRRADFSEARLMKADFTGTDLSKAKFVKADLRNALFKAADLQHADFTDANLSDADLRGANLAGANFKNALLAGAKFDGLDMSKAKNLDPESTKQVKAGTNVKQLEKVARQSKKLVANVELELPKGTVEVHVSCSSSSSGTYVSGGFCYHPVPTTSSYEYIQANTISSAIVALVKRWPKGKPMLNTVAVSASKCPLKKKELLRLATAAWCEAYGVEVPTEEAFAKEKQAEKKRTDSLQKEFLEELHGGAAGVRKWNARSNPERAEIRPLQHHDFAGTTLNGVYFNRMKIQHSIFDKASLKKARMHRCQLRGCRFHKANLRQANLALSNLSEADFDGAILTECNLRRCTFRATTFGKADLTKADFSSAKLMGADLSQAILTDVCWQRASWDETTKFPKGFTIPDELIWKGQGTDPRIEAKIAALPQVGSMSFASFLEQLRKTIDRARLDKALKMLKAERFELFSESNKANVVGVVKSQSSPQLVYACRLTQGGHYACCSNNLKPCGGLRGALCKHLLVLLIGLCKSGAIEPSKVYPWIRASGFRQPELDADVMSEPLLKYKGAEAGQLDWRPTETIPEDYYAL